MPVLSPQTSFEHLPLARQAILDELRSQIRGWLPPTFTGLRLKDGPGEVDRVGLLDQIVGGPSVVVVDLLELVSMYAVIAQSKEEGFSCKIYYAFVSGEMLKAMKAFEKKRPGLRLIRMKRDLPPVVEDHPARRQSFDDEELESLAGFFGF